MVPVSGMGLIFFGGFFKAFAKPRTHVPVFGMGFALLFFVFSRFLQSLEEYQNLEKRKNKNVFFWGGVFTLKYFQGNSKQLLL